MFIDFFYHLRAHQLNVSIQEFLTLLETLRSNATPLSINEFYLCARMCLIKDESLYDRFDRAFGSYYDAIEAQLPETKEIPLEWLIKDFERQLSDEEKAAIEKHGWEKLMELFKERLAEQTERHAGGNRWIGTGGSSPFGHGGYHPEGIRIGGPSAGHRTAVKVWEERQYRDYDDHGALGSRNFKIALRHLRRFVREGAATEFDMQGTIRQTAQKGGLLDIQMRPERRNTIKVLMLLDVGGSMDDHILIVEELFAAARTEFKHLEVLYFHNCPYEFLWTQNHRRGDNRISTWEVLRTYNEDWRLIIVGDATMSPYEIAVPGGSVEHYNEETGAVWLERILQQWPKAVWLNPQPENQWRFHQSLQMIRQITEDRMYGVHVSGIESAMRYLAK